MKRDPMMEWLEKHPPNMTLIVVGILVAGGIAILIRTLA